MKKIVILCDRCEKEIKGYPLKLTAEYAGRVDGETREGCVMPDRLKKLMIDDCERDYCEDCMAEILAFVHLNMDPETYMEEFHGDSAENGHEEKNEDLCEEKKADIPTPKMNEMAINKKLRRGQRLMIEQMYARGVDAEGIAKNMNVDVGTIYNVIRKMN